MPQYLIRFAALTLMPALALPLMLPQDRLTDFPAPLAALGRLEHHTVIRVYNAQIQVQSWHRLARTEAYWQRLNVPAMAAAAATSAALAQWKVVSPRYSMDVAPYSDAAG